MPGGDVIDFVGIIQARSDFFDCPVLGYYQVSRAVALSTLRNYPEAEELFRIAIEIDPNYFEAHYFYGRAFLAQGKYDESIGPLRSACKARAEDYQAPALLGLAYTGMGRREAASRAYAQAIKVAKQQLSVSPGDVRALYLGAGCLARIGRRKTALAWAARALDLDGKTPLFCTTSAACMQSWAGQPMP